MAFRDFTIDDLKLGTLMAIEESDPDEYGLWTTTVWKYGTIVQVWPDAKDNEMAASIKWDWLQESGTTLANLMDLYKVVEY